MPHINSPDSYILKNEQEIHIHRTHITTLHLGPDTFSPLLTHFPFDNLTCQCSLIYIYFVLPVHQFYFLTLHT